MSNIETDIWNGDFHGTEVELVREDSQTYAYFNGELPVKICLGDDNVQVHPRTASDVYLVTWTGGYEDPAFAAVGTLKEAEELAQSWAVDITRIDHGEVRVLSIAPDYAVNTIVTYWYSEDQGELIAAR